MQKPAEPILSNEKKLLRMTGLQRAILRFSLFFEEGKQKRGYGGTNEGEGFLSKNDTCFCLSRQQFADGHQTPPAKTERWLRTSRYHPQVVRNRQQCEDHFDVLHHPPFLLSLNLCLL